jgi:hypothetical protein
MNAQNDRPGSVQVKTYHRLSSSQYTELEKKALGGLRFRDDTGPVQSGFLNGVEHVLRLVREGFTAG